VTDVERCVNTVDFVTDIDRRFWYSTFREEYVGLF
jgi:hypothetical protein